MPTHPSTSLLLFLLFFLLHLPLLPAGLSSNGIVEQSTVKAEIIENLARTLDFASPGKLLMALRLEKEELRKPRNTVDYGSLEESNLPVAYTRGAELKPGTLFQ
ncbi:hypothetical protein L873DRAFT_1791130 [Choiromyces venosus 120613-1]|uniref:Uncharacterized protein n=1 Tax=Choiromyces venosus 120613-1 TaxID=1336337 RepID=A0A3N4JJ30_9PEZI|nr:hypothetical protein L873DRAFT_1791130 [Choiromyces venosus 120613-1]